MQDVAGGTLLLQTRYLVMSEEWRCFIVSVGYGFGPKRLKGAFGGLVKACDCAHLLGENDTRETNLGIRLVTPSIFGFPTSTSSATIGRTSS
jgi:hypothetical protein